MLPRPVHLIFRAEDQSGFERSYLCRTHACSPAICPATVRFPRHEHGVYNDRRTRSARMHTCPPGRTPDGTHLLTGPNVLRAQHDMPPSRACPPAGSTPLSSSRGAWSIGHSGAPRTFWCPSEVREEEAQFCAAAGGGVSTEPRQRDWGYSDGGTSVRASDFSRLYTLPRNFLTDRSGGVSLMKQKSSQVEIGSAHMLTARYPADEGRPEQRCTRRGWTVGLVVRVEAMHSLSQRVPIRLPAVRDLRSGRRIRQAMWLQVLLPSIFSVNNGYQLGTTILSVTDSRKVCILGV